MVRTRDSHSLNRGSIPLTAAKKLLIYDMEKILRFAQNDCKILLFIPLLWHCRTPHPALSHKGARGKIRHVEVKPKHRMVGKFKTSLCPAWLFAFNGSAQSCTSASLFALSSQSASHKGRGESSSCFSFISTCHSLEFDNINATIAK